MEANTNGKTITVESVEVTSEVKVLDGREMYKGEKGDPGYTPQKGIDYFDGKDGYTPVKGVDYFDGEKGDPGNDGYTPIKGVDYFDGKDGYTPVKGKDYFDGKDGYTPIKGTDYFDGEDGKDGISPTISVSNTTDGHKVTINDANGTQEFDVKDGTDGKDGYTPIKGVDYFDGKDGEDGYTPIKGVDYTDGKDGSDANVTAANIQTALGYTPANPSECGALIDTHNTATDAHADIREAAANAYSIANNTRALAGDAYNLGNTAKSRLDAMSTETWTFTLEDGSTVSKVVYVG